MILNYDPVEECKCVEERFRRGMRSALFGCIIIFRQGMIQEWVEDWFIHWRLGRIPGMQVCGGTIQTRNHSGMTHSWIISCRRRMIQPKSAFLDWIVILRHTHSDWARLSTASVSKNEVKCWWKQVSREMIQFDDLVKKWIVQSRNESQSRKWFLIWGQRVGNQAPEHFWVFFGKHLGISNTKPPVWTPQCKFCVKLHQPCVTRESE